MMKKPKITIKVLKEESGFSAIIQLNEIFVGTQADDMEELKVNIIDALNLSFEDQQITFTMADIVLKPDLQLLTHQKNAGQSA